MYRFFYPPSTFVRFSVQNCDSRPTNHVVITCRYSRLPCKIFGAFLSHIGQWPGFAPSLICILLTASVIMHWNKDSCDTTLKFSASVSHQLFLVKRCDLQCQGHPQLQPLVWLMTWLARNEIIINCFGMLPVWRLSRNGLTRFITAVSSLLCRPIGRARVTYRETKLVYIRIDSFVLARKIIH